MDEHARRIIQPLLEGIQAFHSARADPMDLCRLAEQAASALDHRYSALVEELWAASSDFEAFYCGYQASEWPALVEVQVGRILALLDDAG